MNYIFKRIFCRRVEFDRRLVQGQFSTVLRLFGIVMCFPLFIWFILYILTVVGLFQATELICEEALTIDTPSLLWAIIYHFLDPGNQDMTYGGGRIVALILAFGGSIFMNGILISSIVGWYDRYVDKWRCGMARYDETLKRKKFSLIIGTHETVPSIIRQIFDREPTIDYILIQTQKDVEEFRSILTSYLTTNEEKKVILYKGDRTSKDDLRDLYPENAMEIFIIGDSMENDYRENNNHDSMNLACMQIIVDIIRERQQASNHIRKIKCRTLFEYQTSFSIFQYSDVSNNILDILDFKPLNFYELWAQRVFVNQKLVFNQTDLSNYLPLEGEFPIDENSKDTVHLVIVGMSRMGVALAIEAAHSAHYPNFINDPSLKTRITFIDKNCHSEMQYFKGRYKELFSLSKWREIRKDDSFESFYQKEWHNDGILNEQHCLGTDFIDIEWEFIERGIEDEDVHNYLQYIAGCNSKRFTIAICLPDDNRSIAASIYLPEIVYEKAIQVLVYQYHSSSIVDSISINNKMNLYYKQLKAFGMMKDAYDDSLICTQEYIADILGNEYGKMYEMVKQQHNIREANNVQQTRGKSKIAKYWSNVYNANNIWCKLRSIHYKENSNSINEHDVEILAITEHNRWVIEQLLMRYRPLSLEEQKRAACNPLYKEELKGCKMAHLDICAYNRLKEIDPNVLYFDKGFIEILPNILNAIKNKTNERV